MKIWGIAGQIGSGKTTLAEILSEYGAVNLEVDSIGHQLLETQDVKQALVQAFGPSIITPSGNIDRKHLGHLAFASQETKKTLNHIMHPPMVDAVKIAIESARKAGKVVFLINAALLYSMGLESFCELSIYVRTTANIRLDRIVTLRGLPLESAKARLWAQDPEPTPSNRVILCDNNGTLEDLREWVKKVLNVRF